MCGRFVNGDWWVVGPVTVTSITPATTVIDGKSMHGSMINPQVYQSTSGKQGFDSRLYVTQTYNSYDPTYNVALSLPLTIQPGSSLLSCESYVEDQVLSERGQLKTMVVLTVLAEPAPEGPFRPPYVGTDKTLYWNKSQIDYSKLRSLPYPGTHPGGNYDLAVLASRFERPWIEIDYGWTGRSMHPDLNMPSLSGGNGTYGREMANVLAAGLLSLQLDFSLEQKETLLIRLIQYGIDVYGAAKNGAVWYNNGGHNMGRKMPLLFAGYMLGDENITEYGDAQKHFIFQEDQQTFYVSQEDVDRPRYTGDGRRRDPYTPDMIGMPEWGEQHTGNPSRDGSNWDAYYREINGSSIIGHVLTAHLLGLKDEWNWPALFDYMDRYYQAYLDGHVGIGQAFVKDLWVAYRYWQPDVPSDISINPDYVIYDQSTDQTASFAVTYQGAEESKEIILFAATYDADNRLTQLLQKKMTCLKDSQLPIELDVPENCKIFLWEWDSMIPLIEKR